MSDTRLNFLLSSLRNDVNRRFAKRLQTASDYIRLSEAISESKAGYISPSTLKRFWGYIRDGYSTRRITTLDILARYIDYSGFSAYCESLSRSDNEISDYNSALSLDVQTLHSGCKLRVSWHPDRIVSMTYLGELTFSIDESINSKLTPGIKVKCLTLVKGQPLILNILPSDEGSPSQTYIAGKKHGIDWKISD